MQKLKGFLRLMRPANIVTAVADILAGIIISGYLTSTTSYSLLPVFLLALSTIGLYGGGVVFNDVFDAELDKLERPERPIPSGLVRKQSAIILALLLLLGGIIAAYFVQEDLFSLPVLFAIAISIASIIYDKWGKHQAVAGPVNMGLCRGLNLLLGMSIVPAAVSQYWWLGIFPVIYIGAITMISRGEVHGGKKTTIYIAAFLYLFVLAAISWFAYTNGHLLYATGFILLFGIIIMLPLRRAMKNPVAKNIRHSVKAGVLAVILMNAAWAAAFGAIGWALIILCLLPLSLLFARLFAVT